MTQLKHTSGPWEIEVGQYGQYKVIAPNAPELKSIGIVISSLHTRANARLIAAAPDMKTLLERIVRDRNAWRENKIGTTGYEIAMRHNIDDAARLLQKIA
jgi:hypothetical protein